MCCSRQPSEESLASSKECHGLMHCGHTDRLITTVLLHDFFQSGAKTYQELSEYLEAVREHPVGRLWVDCLIKPTLLALQLLRAQRDGGFLLQQVSLEAMMPYFFAAGHMNYTPYIVYETGIKIVELTTRKGDKTTLYFSVSMMPIVHETICWTSGKSSLTRVWRYCANDYHC